MDFLIFLPRQFGFDQNLNIFSSQAVQLIFRGDRAVLFRAYSVFSLCTVFKLFIVFFASFKTIVTLVAMSNKNLIPFTLETLDRAIF